MSRSTVIAFVALMVLVAACGGPPAKENNADFIVDVGGLANSQEDADEIKEKIASLGLLDELNLVSLKAFRDTQGEINGEFSIFGGSIEGSLEQQNNHVFMFTIDGQSYIVELPADKLVFQFEDVEQAIVKFKFMITSENFWSNRNLADNTPQNWIKPEYIFAVYITMPSPEHLGEYIILP